MVTQPSQCSEYRDDSWCNVKRLRDMSLEIGAWGCAPWIGLWPILVFFAPVPEKEKIKIFVASLAFYGYGIILAVESANIETCYFGSKSKQKDVPYQSLVKMYLAEKVKEETAAQHVHPEPS